MSKGLKTFLPVWLVFAVVVSVITWVIPVDHNELFFIGYGFIMGSLLLQLVVVVISMKNEQKDVKIPAVTFSIVGTVLSVAISFVCILLKTKTWVPAVLCTAVLGLNMITVLLSNDVRKRAIGR